MSKQQHNGKQKNEGRRYHVIGTPRPKVDAYGKVTGRALYADDIMLPRMVYGRLLRSPHAHARILSINARRALELPGVLAVLTGEDLPQKFGILPSSQDEYALAIDKVRYVGDPVAAVAALDPDILDEAMKLIEVEYEVLPELMSIDEALAHPEVKIKTMRVLAISIKPSHMNSAIWRLVLPRRTISAKTGSTTKATTTRHLKRMLALQAGNPTPAIPLAAK